MEVRTRSERRVSGGAYMTTRAMTRKMSAAADRRPSLRIVEKSPPAFHVTGAAWPQRKREAVETVYELKPMPEGTDLPNQHGAQWAEGV